VPQSASQAGLFVSDAIRLAEPFNRDQRGVQRSEAELAEG